MCIDGLREATGASIPLLIKQLEVKDSGVLLTSVSTLGELAKHGEFHQLAGVAS
jgi:hypothetical protein